MFGAGASLSLQVATLWPSSSRGRLLRAAAIGMDSRNQFCDAVDVPRRVCPASQGVE